MALLRSCGVELRRVAGSLFTGFEAGGRPHQGLHGHELDQDVKGGAAGVLQGIPHLQGAEQQVSQHLSCMNMCSTTTSTATGRGKCRPSQNTTQRSSCPLGPLSLPTDAPPYCHFFVPPCRDLTYDTTTSSRLYSTCYLYRTATASLGRGKGRPSQTALYRQAPVQYRLV
jgi:hypothetical protein